MLSRSGSTYTMTVADWSEQRGKILSVDAWRPHQNTVTRTTMEPSFLIDGLGLDQSLFESPIHQLPPELLSHIFSFDDRTADTFPTPFVWTVAHVCGHWRQVAFNTPRLWSTIVLDVSSLHSINERLVSRLQFLDTCLALSKSVPLDFVVALRGRKKIDACNAVLSRFCLHAHRWRRAFFFCPTDVLAPWSHLIRGKTPMLESLGFGSVGEGIGSVELQNIFTGCGVSRLALSYCHPETFDAFRIHWNQITSLKLAPSSFNTLPAILSRFPNLTELEIEGELSRSRVLDAGYLIDLPNLLTLRISGYSHRVAQLLSILHIPALVTLSIILFRALDINSDEYCFSARVIVDFLRAAKQIKHPVVTFMKQNEENIWSHAIRYIQ